jgi:pSer/pThr/pTyr-binding forkhead associated (FHA) protein
MSTGATSQGSGEDLRLEVVSGKASGFAIVVGERLVIGRHSEGPGRLADDPELSRHHAQISRDESGMYLIEDLASTNGTIVNGARISSPIPLAVGDSIEVGATTIRVAEAPVKPGPPAGVDVRAATVTVDTPAEMRSAPPPPIQAEPSPSDADSPPTEAIAPRTEATAPPTEETPPALTQAPPEPAAEPADETPPTEAAEPAEAEEASSPAPLAEVPPPQPLEELPTPLDEAPPLAEVPPPPPDEAPGEPSVLQVEEPGGPRLALQLMFDPHSAEVEIRLDDASEPIRLALTEGRWQIKPDPSD